MVLLLPGATTVMVWTLASRSHGAVGLVVVAGRRRRRRCRSCDLACGREGSTRDVWEISAPEIERIARGKIGGQISGGRLSELSGEKKTGEMDL